ncbi:MAG: carboxypeptidase-like regulatory domain-containing protein [Planctomycetaceae bacterium]|nr:carboxypeptidase-like regulatory domain-containing protein [Planctomycetaceae bacterium]
MLFVIASVLTCGCSNKPYQPKKKAESIAGTVTFNDKAIADTEIYFSDTARGINLTVKTGADGKFTIAPKDLPVGRYATFITPANPKDIPQKYQSPMESPLYLEIKEGNNDLKVMLEK